MSVHTARIKDGESESYSEKGENYGSFLQVLREPLAASKAVQHIRQGP